MQHNNDFKHDLKLGQKGENLLASILEAKGDTVEVKTDLQAMKTGNLFIEYESRGKKSGIAKTQAIWYSFVLSNTIILTISTEKLKTICREYHQTDRDILGGDSNTSKGILLPIKKILLNE